MMRFSVSNSINGNVVMKTDGVADISGEKGIVTFNDEEGGTMDLPKGVLFPIAHTQKILAAATDGKKLLSAKVFDGNGRDGLQDSLTIIGKKSLKISEVLEKNGMGSEQSWSIQMSYFDLGSQSNEPDYVVKFRMFENGVGTDLHLKYKDFSMKGELVQLELNEEKHCK
ncbi:EipB family protein [Sneathiella glossodoripedis]|uniref:EipB family protein n=1 Tax=Sneathiella glossodoripedis TaxID=418853 RepID=UPI000471F834